MEQRIGKKKSEIARTRVLLRTRRQNHEETKLALRSVLSSSASGVLTETSSQEIKEISELESAFATAKPGIANHDAFAGHAITLHLEDAQESEEMLGMTETAFTTWRRDSLSRSEGCSFGQRRWNSPADGIEQGKGQAMEMETGKQVERQPLVLREQMLLQSQMAWYRSPPPTTHIHHTAARMK